MRTFIVIIAAVLISITGSSAMSNVQEAQAQSLDFRGGKLHMLVAGPEEGRPVLLLHGMRFHSGTWQEIGTYRRLAEEGFRVVGLDLPGFGHSEEVEVDREKFLAELLPVLGLDQPVIVAPSMSGGFAFPFLIHHPTGASGFVGVAPAGIDYYESELGKIRVPTLIVWGEKDSMVPLAMGERMRNSIDGSRLIVLKGASHPAYLDRPEEFHQALIDFLKTSSKD
jgi:abhydrolase domain-containing protein 14